MWLSCQVPFGRVRQAASETMQAGMLQQLKLALLLKRLHSITCTRLASSFSPGSVASNATSYCC
eukprot:5497841-Amphidinium_carterae.1